MLYRIILIVVFFFFPFITLNTSCHCLLACRVSAEKSADSLMRVLFYVCCHSVDKSCSILCNPMDCSMPCQTSLSFTISQSLLKFMSVELMIPLNHLILCCPLLLLPSVFPSIRVFSIESALHIQWPKYWSFSFSIIPSSEYSGLISFLSKGFSRILSSSTLQKHQFFSAQPSLWSNSHSRT